MDIALNMHGTRAVQKMVEFTSSVEQVESLSRALNGSVVTLIKDLNGNHVIQRCLLKLTYPQKQFMFVPLSFISLSSFFTIIEWCVSLGHGTGTSQL